jgi:signal transduction histidine kinase
MTTSPTSATILIVDDELLNRKLLETLLHAEGYRTVSATSGEDALACVSHQAPDLILLDVMMPGMNGYQVARTLKADPVTSSIPIILVTALTDRSARIDGLETGAEDFLTKPFDREELWLRVRNLLRMKEFAGLVNHARILEEQVELRTSQLQAANLELQAFSYSVAHDLRSPLSTITGFTNLLYKEIGAANASERSQHFIDRIKAGAAQMSELIDALLSLAQLSRIVLRWENVNLSALSQTILDNYRDRESSRVVKVDIQPNLVVQGDPHLLRDVLENLLSNAWKYSSHEPQTQIAFRHEVGPEGELTYVVQDNGAGFDMAYSDKLFGAFQRLHTLTEFSGIGIGLATTHKIITCHGGRIWAKSAPGQGAMFYFTLGKPQD